MQSFNEYIIKAKNLKNNIKSIKKRVDSKICAVVKADGYGLKIENILPIIDDLVDFYAVACFKESKITRRFTNKKILVLNCVPNSCVIDCVNNDISISILNLKQLKGVISILKKSKTKNKLNIHFAINTGMNRIGFKEKNEFYKAVLLCKRNQSLVNIEGIFTHFYNAEFFDITEKQVGIFMQFLNILALHFDISEIIKHTSNSVGSILYKDFEFDMVRIGIGMYSAMNESCLKHKHFVFLDAVEIKSKIVNISNVKKGEHIGYGNTFAKKDMKVATIPLGYADGIFRCYAKKGYVLCCGKFCKIVGRICMDMFMIDVSHINANLYDEVILIGTDKFGNKITLNDVAKCCDTISYEILTSIKQNRFDVKIK